MLSFQSFFLLENDLISLCSKSFREYIVIIGVNYLMVYADNINDSLAIMKRVVERRCVYMDFNNGIDSTNLPLGLAFGLAMEFMGSQRVGHN